MPIARFILPAGLTGLALVLVAVACNWRLHTRTPPREIGRAASQFALPDHAGETHTLDQVLAGGAGVVVFYRGHW